MRHPLDLRLRAVKASYQKGMTILKAATLFGLSLAALTRWRKIYRETGSVVGKPAPKGFPPRMGPAELALASQKIQENNDLTLQELSQELSQQLGFPVSLNMVSRTVKRLGLTRKKKR